MPFTAFVNDIPATIVTLRFVMYSAALGHVLQKDVTIPHHVYVAFYSDNRFILTPFELIMLTSF